MVWRTDFKLRAVKSREELRRLQERMASLGVVNLRRKESIHRKPTNKGRSREEYTKRARSLSLFNGQRLGRSGSYLNSHTLITSRF